MAVHPKCMFTSERVRWYKVCLSVTSLITANCTISMGKFNAKIKHYSFLKISNGKRKANQNFTNRLDTTDVSN
jgi:hypothetical protein